MGVLTRQQGTQYVISSDLEPDQKGNKRAPRIQDGIYQVWTGAEWSTNLSNALSFDSLDEADEYVRANFSRLVGK
jgi:hypothetical protein